MKRIFSTILMVCIAIAMTAVPARRIQQTILLEDGTQKSVVLQGDEFGHWYVDSEDQAYQQCGNHYRQLSAAEHAKLKQHAALQSAKRNAAYSQQSTAVKRTASKKTPSINIAPRGLLILVNFSDVAYQAGNTQAEMDSMLNGTAYQYDIAYGSARQYFYDQSNGAYNPQFDVIGPVTLPHPMAYYGANTTDEEDIRPGQMVLEACSIASEIPGVDFANYDNDGDDWVDFVYVIYAGYGEADGAEENTLWPASFDMPSAIYFGYTDLTPGETGDWDNFPQYTFDGKIIGSFAYSAELNYYNSALYPTRGYTTANPMRGGIGTFCHEFSHVLGLPDYYDTEYGDNYYNFLTPCRWNLMDEGAYNKDGEVPPNYACHDKAFLGWAQPTLIHQPANITLAADGQTSCYITENGQPASPTDEQVVYYLENRQKTGWDQGLPSHGMLVWRVHYNDSIWYENTPNNAVGDMRYMYIAADGDYTGGDKGDTFPGYTKQTDYTPFANYPLTNIQETDGIISFDFMGGELPPSALTDYSTHTTQKIIRDGRILILRNGAIFDILGNNIK